MRSFVPFVQAIFINEIDQSCLNELSFAFLFVIFNVRLVIIYCLYGDLGPIVDYEIVFQET